MAHPLAHPLASWRALTRFLSRRPFADVSWTALDDAWYGMPGRRSASGMPVSPDLARQLTAVSGCVKVIAETAAIVPAIVYREIPAGKERATDYWLYQRLRRKPNRWQNSLEWREMMTGHAALRGIAYSEMVGATRETLELIPRHPDRVSVLDTDASGFATSYEVRDWHTGTPRPVPASRLFVLRGPWGGQSPVKMHCESIGLGLAMQEHAARYFGNGSNPGGLLKSPAGASLDQAQRDRIKASWEYAHRGPQQAHRVAVLEGGMEWQQLGLSAKDSQLMEVRQFHVTEICRIWGVPPYKIQEYGRSTWGNTEQMAIDFLTGCMLPWFRRWEEAIQWYLIDDDEPIFAEFLVEGLLRGDTQTRYAAYNVATGGRAWMAPNEVRERENMNKIDGLDEVATVAQGAAPNPGARPTPQRQPDPPTDPGDGDETDDTATGGARIWDAWASAVAETLVHAEVRGLERFASLEARDPRAYAEQVHDFYLGKHRDYVDRRLRELQAAWRGAVPITLAVAQITTAGDDWALTAPRDVDARRANILAVLTQGGPSAVAA